MRFLTTIAFFCALACGACSSSEGTTTDGGCDAGIGGDADTLRRELVVEAADPIELRYLERATLRVTVIDAETREPVSNVEVRFSIFDGQSIDLGPDRLVTDANGVVEKTITAGQDDADAAIRILTEGANGSIVAVRVRAAGAASLNVQASYDGTRRTDSWVVDLFESNTCAASANLAIGTKSQRIVGSSLPSFRFVGLSPDAQYAVRVRGFGSASATTPIVAGCEETPELSAATMAELVVPTSDTELFVADLVEMRLSISATGAPLFVTSTIAQAVSSSAGAGTGELGWLLDGMRESIATQGGDADAWDALRSDATFKTALDGAFARAEKGPRAALANFVNTLAPIGEGILLDGTLADASGTLRFEPARLSMSRLPEGASEAAFADVLTTISAEVSARFDAELGSFAFERFDLSLGLGTLSKAVLRTSADETAEGAIARVFQTTGGCDTLATAVMSAAADVCDDECIRAACDASYEAASIRIAEAFDSIDALCPALQLHGSVEASDSDANGSVDHLSTSTFGLSGQWGSPDVPLVALSASVSGADFAW